MVYYAEYLDSAIMTKLHIFFLILIFCSSAFADPIVYICERPAWEGVEGCGPDSTYSTYKLSVETDDFGKRKPIYGFQVAKGCDASKGARVRRNYEVNEESITFKYYLSPQKPATIKLDRESMKAVLSRVTKSPELSCRMEEGDDSWSKGYTDWHPFRTY